METAPRTPYWLVGIRNAGTFFGHKGDDVFWSFPWRLAQEYNWTYDKAEIELLPMRARARLNNAGALPMPMLDMPAGTMWVSVHGWADIFGLSGGSVDYITTVSLKGPKGVPMMRSALNGQGMMPDGSFVSIP